MSTAPRPQILRAVGRCWARATSPVTPGTAGLLRPPCERQVVGAQLTPEPARSGNSPTPCWPQAFGGQAGRGLGCGPHPHACPNPSWPLRTTVHGRPGSRCPLLSCPSSLPGQALLHSLCSENFIKPLVVPFGVTESQIIVPTENRFLLPLTHPPPSPSPQLLFSLGANKLKIDGSSESVLCRVCTLVAFGRRWAPQPSPNVLGEGSEEMAPQIAVSVARGSVFVGSRCKDSGGMQSPGGRMPNGSRKHTYTSRWRL